VVAIILFLGFLGRPGARPCSSSQSAVESPAARAALQTQTRGRPGVHEPLVRLRLPRVLASAFPIALLTGNHANASSQVGGLKLTASEKTGARALFGERCGVCHTLAAAKRGRQGRPRNLDQLGRRPASLVVRHDHERLPTERLREQARSSASGRARLPRGNPPRAGDETDVAAVRRTRRRQGSSGREPWGRPRGRGANRSPHR